MPKYTVSKVDKDCSTRFLERDGLTLTCPYHTSYDKDENTGKVTPSNAQCGDWCPLFDRQLIEGKQEVVYLLCGSGNAAYTIEK